MPEHSRYLWLSDYAGLHSSFGSFASHCPMMMACYNLEFFHRSDS